MNRFNYVTSAALDGGTTIAVLVIFLAVQIHQSQGLRWWGNNLNSKSKYSCLCCLAPPFGSLCLLVLSLAGQRLNLYRPPPFATPPNDDMLIVLSL